MRARFLMPSMDMTDLEEAVRLARAVASDDFVSSFKFGFALGLSAGLPAAVRAFRAFTQKPIVYDHQKAGTDIPDTGVLFAKTMRAAGIDEAILFPQAGPVTLEAWVKALQDAGIVPVVGAVMTHKGFTQSEGGYLSDAGMLSAYELAAKLGVRKFVVPLTKPAVAESVAWPEGSVFYSPGFGAQGGDPHAFAQLPEHHLIAGRSLAAATDAAAYVRQVAAEYGAP